MLPVHAGPHVTLVVGVATEPGTTQVAPVESRLVNIAPEVAPVGTHVRSITSAAIPAEIAPVGAHISDVVADESAVASQLSTVCGALGCILLGIELGWRCDCLGLKRRYRAEENGGAERRSVEPKHAYLRSR